MLNLISLHTFVEVAQHGSFLKAALKLGISQPAVSMQVRKLERTLGVRLLDRVGKRAMPTAAGRDLIEFALRLETESQAAIAHMRRYSEGRLGRIRVGTGATASIYLLPEVLTALRKTHPLMEVSVVTGDSSAMVDGVMNNSIDIGIITLPVSGRPALAVRKIIDDPLVAIVPASDDSVPAVITPTHFVDRDVILYDKTGTIRTLIDDWLRSDGSNVRARMDLGNVEATKRIVAAGLGWSIVPSMALRSKHDQSNLLVRPLKPKLKRELGMVLRHDKVRDAAMRAAIAAFADIKR